MFRLGLWEGVFILGDHGSILWEVVLLLCHVKEVHRGAGCLSAFCGRVGGGAGGRMLWGVFECVFDCQLIYFLNKNMLMIF